MAISSKPESNRLINHLDRLLYASESDPVLELPSVQKSTRDVELCDGDCFRTLPEPMQDPSTLADVTGHSAREFMLASRPIVSIRLDLPEPLIPIRTFSGANPAVRPIRRMKGDCIPKSVQSVWASGLEPYSWGGRKRSVIEFLSAGPAYQNRAIGNAGQDLERL